MYYNVARTLVIIIFFSAIRAENLKSQSVEYKKVEWEVVKIGQCGLNNNEVSLGTEVRHNFNYKLSFGIEAKLATPEKLEHDNYFLSGVQGQVFLTSDYYYNLKTELRPFAGAGIGLLGEGWGYSGRLGIELWHFRLLLDYSVPFREVRSSSVSYCSIQLGFTLWGGPKE